MSKRDLVCTAIARHKFSKVTCIVTGCHKYTRALTFQNLCAMPRSGRGLGRVLTGARERGRGGEGGRGWGKTHPSRKKCWYIDR